MALIAPVCKTSLSANNQNKMTETSHELDNGVR